MRRVAGKRVAVAGFRAELEEQIGRREPFHLHAVLLELSAEERLVGERLIDEVPRVRVHFVEIAEAGEEASALRGEAVGQRERAEERFLDLDFVLGGDAPRSSAPRSTDRRSRPA